MRAEVRAYSAWSRAAEPFWQYVAALPFTTPSSGRRATLDLERGASLARTAILPLLEPMAERSLLLLDLPFDRGLATTLAFQDAGWLVVPMVYRWTGQSTVLPTATAQSQLIWLSRRLRRPADPRGLVLVLDGERQGMPSARLAPRRLDNRYLYPSDTFPPAPALREWQIAAAAVAAPYRELPDDLFEYSARLGRAGIATTRIWVPTDDAALARG